MVILFMAVCRYFDIIMLSSVALWYTRIVKKFHFIDCVSIDGDIVFVIVL